MFTSLSTLTENFEITPIMVLLVALSFLMLVLLAIALRNTISIHHLTYPVYDYTMKKAEDEAAGIVREARERAAEIAASAEKEAAVHVEKQKREAETLSEHYEQQLKALAEHNKGILERYTTLANETYRAFDASVQEESVSVSQAVQKELEQLLIELRDEHAKLRRHFATQFEKRMAEEFAAAQESIERYREAQLRLIDNRIIALVEHAAVVAFQKELTIKDHTDMIYRSLEEAKKEGVI